MPAFQGLLVNTLCYRVKLFGARVELASREDHNKRLLKTVRNAFGQTFGFCFSFSFSLKRREVSIALALQQIAQGQIVGQVLVLECFHRDRVA